MKKLFYYVASVLLLGLAINCSDKKSEGESWQLIVLIKNPKGKSQTETCSAITSPVDLPLPQKGLPRVMYYFRSLIPGLLFLSIGKER
jgi:hypothetical protein